MSDQIAEIIGITVLTIGILSLPAATFIYVVPPKWLEDWMDKREAEREKRRAARRRRKKPA